MVYSMLRKSLIATRIVNGIRRYWQTSKHHAIVKKYKLNYYSQNNRAQAEVRARDLVRRAESATAWIPAPLYPAGGAAGALLLYILIRALRELPIERVLELGAGQTTQLLDAWARASGGNVFTFEHDQYWADRIAATVNPTKTHVHHLPLVDIPAPGGFVKWYANPPANAFPKDGFDLVIVDGPVGTSRLSRYGIIEHIPTWLNKEWAVIWDDLDRPADLESFAHLIQRLRADKVVHDHVLLDGDRTIGLIYTPNFLALQYMW